MKTTSALLLGVALLLAGGAARADAATDQAKTFFNMGAQAYAAGQFPAALQAFGEAYRISPRPGILFSVAQAHRRQFYLDKKAEHLSGAIKSYRDYLAAVEQGGRRAEAAEALAELEAVAARLDMASAAAAPAPSPVLRETRLMVSSQTKGAQVSLDGGKPAEVPLISEVKPGKHRLRVMGEGYFEEQREIEVSAGGLVALDIPLRERSARLSIATRDGAQVTIDGRQAATTPLARPLEVESGHHLITITKNGYKAFSKEIDLGRDEARSLDAKLQSTGQRVASYVLFGASALGIAAGVGVAAEALKQQDTAQKIADKRFTNQINCPDLTAGCEAKTYEKARTARDDLRRIAGVGLVAGLSFGVTGLMLFVFDQPGAAAVGGRLDNKSKPAPSSPPARDMPMEMAAAPILGPGLYGAAVSGRF